MPVINLKINKRIFNDVYFPYLLDYSHRYEIYYGSAGSGKSHFVFQKFVIKACQQQRKILVVRKTAKSNENSTFQMTKDTLNSFNYHIKSENPSKEKFTFGTADYLALYDDFDINFMINN